MLLQLLENTSAVVGIAIAVTIFITILIVARWYKKVPQGKALIRTGFGGLTVSFNGMVVVPVLHRLEIMDISVKSVTISRTGKEGLICKDNMRADIKVVFFVRVNPKKDDVKQVAQSIGAARASDPELLVELFDAKFSEALKTVGKKFEFVELYDKRKQFKSDMLEEIGDELNGYLLDGSAIDYLEQTDIKNLSEMNILDSEGIKKITDLTAQQKTVANQIRREEEKTITKQNVEARESILLYNQQLAEKEEEQRKEIASIKARAESETIQVQSQEKLKSEKARIESEEEIQIAEENKQRQIIIAAKSKETVEAKETEKVKKAKELEAVEREKAVELAQIEKKKDLETNLRDIQGVVKGRIELERKTVEEEEKIKDTRAMAEAERKKSVALKLAEQKAEEALVEKIKSAEANRNAAELKAEQDKLEANVREETALKNANSKKIMAEATAAEAAAIGLSEAQVLEAKAEASRKEGGVQAEIIQKKSEAEAEGIKMKSAAENEAYAERGQIDAKILEEKGLAETKVLEVKAEAIRKQGDAEAEVLQKKGLAEADVMEKKAQAEAMQIEAKAEAMKKLDGIGIEHEEFKLRLQQETEIAMAKISIQKEIAEAQAMALSEAFKSSKINVVGGETMFYENIMNAVTRGRSFDSMINNSDALGQLKDNLLGSGENGSDASSIIKKLRSFVSQFGINSEDLKNLSIAALISKLSEMSSDNESKGILDGLLNFAQSAGIDKEKASKWF